MAKGKYQIPFDKDGNQLHYPESWRGFEMRDNYEFNDVIRFSHFSRGRSAAYAIFKTSQDKTLTVFLSDLQDMMPKIERGVIDGKFTFVKKGQNYGCALAKIQ